jgi:DNA-binding MltR family transcriptional regulator
MTHVGESSKRKESIEMTDWRPFKPEELSEDVQKVFDVLNDESDLACVLIGSSYLGELLASILEVRFIKGNTAKRLLDPNGAIGTFQARADLAYCLGLIDKSAYQDLSLIAEIRNTFAHKHVALDFGKSAIQATQEELRNRARNQFKISVALLSQRINVDALSLKGKGELQYPPY